MVFVPGEDTAQPPKPPNFNDIHNANTAQNQQNTNPSDANSWPGGGTAQYISVGNAATGGTRRMSVEDYALTAWQNPKIRKQIVSLASQQAGYRVDASRAFSAWRGSVQTAANRALSRGVSYADDPMQILADLSSGGRIYDSNSSGGGGYGGPSGPTPEELAIQRRQFRSEIRKEAESYGIGLSRKQVARLAEIQQKKGLTATEVTNRLVKHLEMPESGDLSGKAGVVQDELGKWAYANGVSISDNKLIDYTQKIIKGSADIDTIKSDLRKTYVAGAYPAWADRIAAGEDIADIAEPYRATAAKLLEVDDVALDDPIVKRGLQSVGADGKPRVMPLYEYEKMIRTDSRWQNTNNAKTTYLNAAQEIARTFGFA